MRGNLRPHLDHGLVPCHVGTFADLDTDYSPDYTENWRSVKRQRFVHYFSSGDSMFFSPMKGRIKWLSFETEGGIQTSHTED